MAAFFATRGRQRIFHGIILFAEREIASEAARLSESRLGIEPE